MGSEQCATTEENRLPDRVVERLRLRFGDEPFSFTDLVDFSLYDPEVGYFTGEDAGVQLVDLKERPISYSNLDEPADFIKLVRQIHRENPGAYKTPVEIHSPYYAIGIARHIEAAIKLGNLDPVIYEVGAGRGTLAKDILDYWRKYNPDLHKKVAYRIVDSSDELVQIQKERLAEHRDNVEWIRGDARHLPFQDKSLNGILLSTELLDNLPHACVWRKTKSEGDEIDLSVDYVQVGYRLNGNQLVEVELPMSEELIRYIVSKRSLHSVFYNMPVGNRGYLDVGGQGFFEELFRVFNKGCVMSFDFCSLPTAYVDGDYKAMNVHRGREALSFEDSIGQADVYFSVDNFALNTAAKALGFTTILNQLGQARFWSRAFDIEQGTTTDEFRQLSLGGEGVICPLFTDYQNTFALVHWVGQEVQGDTANRYYETLNRVVDDHAKQNEDLTLGREVRN